MKAQRIQKKPKTIFGKFQAPLPLRMKSTRNYFRGFHTQLSLYRDYFKSKPKTMVVFLTNQCVKSLGEKITTKLLILQCKTSKPWCPIFRTVTFVPRCCDVIGWLFSEPETKGRSRLAPMNRYTAQIVCRPHFHKTAMVAQHEDPLTRKIIDAHRIVSLKYKYVSTASRLLRKKKLQFLSNH